MPVPTIVVLRLSLIVSWIAAVHRPTPGWGKDSAGFEASDRSKLLEGGFAMGEFEGGSFLFQVSRSVVYDAAGGVVGSLRSRIIDRLES